MSWIAKNSITGKTYGKKYSSIYDCQKFIDDELFILQYEYGRLKGLEDSFDNEIGYQKWAKKHLPKEGNFVANEIIGRISYALFGDSLSSNYKGAYAQNVIRCWYVEQGRFADGFDF